MGHRRRPPPGRCWGTHVSRSRRLIVLAPASGTPAEVHPLLAQLVELAVKAAHTEGRLAYDPHRDWLPGTDRTNLPDT